MRVFLGITGASGAPYAARLLEALAAAECEVGVCASSAGIEVLATELYGNARLSRDETLARVLERAPHATVYDPNYQSQGVYYEGPQGALHEISWTPSGSWSGVYNLPPPFPQRMHFRVSGNPA